MKMGTKFTFSPDSLLKERIQSEKIYQFIEEHVLQKKGPIVLPRLVGLIQNMKKENVVFLARDLSIFDIKLIMRGYPFFDAPWQARLNINYILIERFESWIGQAVWGLFQQECHDPIIQDLIKEIYKIDGGSFLKSSSTGTLSFVEVFQHPQGPLAGLGELLIRNNRPFRENLSLLNIREGSNLESYLLYYMLHKGFRSDWIITREGMHQIVNYLALYPKEIYSVLLQSYLEHRQIHQFHNEILSQALYIFKDPRQRPGEWTLLKEAVLEKVNSWLIHRELKTYFDRDNKRFEFWEKYSPYMEKVFKLDSPNIVFLYFKRFVVMEFGEEGAAHFYDKKGFEECILPILSSREFNQTQNVSKKESMIKITTPYVTGRLLFIKKLNHTKNWETNFAEFLKGHFNLS
jgi:hypothetical protein